MLSLTLGCMYAGKTSALIRDIPIMGQSIVIDYDISDPYSSKLYSHDDVCVPCIKTSNLSKLDVSIFDTILINEAQFFKGLVDFVKGSLDDGKTVLVYGLDGDFKQDVFGELLYLIPLCDSYVKLYAKCKCGKNAPFSKRLSSNKDQYMPHDKYVPSCRTCFITSE
jgi:thymidine kinase